VAEANSDDGGVTMEGMYKGIKEEDRAMTSDPAREGPIKAEEEGDIARDTAKDSMDGAWIGWQLKMLNTRLLIEMMMMMIIGKGIELMQQC
jgi:hypothetical protein